MAPDEIDFNYTVGDALNESFHDVLNQTLNATRYFENRYDAAGAMKFTIVLVVIFSVGVIGVLGIYAHRKITEDLSVEEAKDVYKKLEKRRRRMESVYCKNVAGKCLVEYVAERSHQYRAKRHPSTMTASSGLAEQESASLTCSCDELAKDLVDRSATQNSDQSCTVLKLDEREEHSRFLMSETDSFRSLKNGSAPPSSKETNSSDSSRKKSQSECESASSSFLSSDKANPSLSRPRPSL